MILTSDRHTHTHTHAETFFRWAAAVAAETFFRWAAAAAAAETRRHADEFTRRSIATHTIVVVLPVATVGIVRAVGVAATAAASAATASATTTGVVTVTSLANRDWVRSQHHVRVIESRVVVVLLAKLHKAKALALSIAGDDYRSWNKNVNELIEYGLSMQSTNHEPRWSKGSS